MWNSGRVCMYTTKLWCAGVAVPIDCGPRAETQTGRKLRPIVLLETLPKFAEAVGLDEANDQVRRVLEPEQLGAGTPDGNIILLRALQAWSKEMAEANYVNLAAAHLNALEAVVALDLTNAYGFFHRSGALAEVRECLPQLLGMLRAQWQNKSNAFWMRVNGEWVQKETTRGGFQGLRLITVIFCCSLKRSMRQGLAENGEEIAKPKYQDDSYLAGKLGDIANEWEKLQAALTEGGHVLNMRKSEFWIPGADGLPTEDLPEEMGHFASMLPRAYGGLMIMGNAAQGDFKAMLGPDQLRMKPARERLNKAIALERRLCDYIDGSKSTTKLHEAWCMTRFCLKECLSYDIRVIPSTELMPLLDDHADLMRHACDVIAGAPLTDVAFQRLQLPGPLSGMGVTLPTSCADAAFVATWQATAARISTVCQMLGRPIKAH
eukprot:3648938-Karenia_brevis.AAC.1